MLIFLKNTSITLAGQYPQGMTFSVSVIAVFLAVFMKSLLIAT